MGKRTNKPAKGKRTTAKRVAQEDAKPFSLPTVPVKVEPDDGAWGRDGVNVRQRLFAKAYVGPAAGNASKAAEMAGYNCENANSLAATASQILRRPNVQRLIAREVAKRTGGKRWTLAGLVEIAGSSAADFIEFDANGKPAVSLTLAADAAALGRIKKFKVREFDGGQEVTLEMYDRLSALRTLAEIHGELIQRHEVSGPDGGDIKHAFDYDGFARQFQDFARRRVHDRGDAAPAENGN